MLATKLLIFISGLLCFTFYLFAYGKHRRFPAETRRMFFSRSSAKTQRVAAHGKHRRFPAETRRKAQIFFSQQR